MIWFIIGLIIGVVAFTSIELIINHKKKKKKDNTNVKDKN